MEGKRTGTIGLALLLHRQREARALAAAPSACGKRKPRRAASTDMPITLAQGAHEGVECRMP
ncbi:hypothetical protein [Paenibacillus humicus]|uniref:hypothetical protein n=1 Tax=Paenibacillus humicus TaxID=412861 RepID=UPI001C3F8603|nr:hypothetical protein [Paenibacillus humicus]